MMTMRIHLVLFVVLAIVFGNNELASDGSNKHLVLAAARAANSRTKPPQLENGMMTTRRNPTTAVATVSDEEEKNENDDDDDDKRDPETMTDTDDVTHSNISPTTYRPLRSTAIVPVSPAQERDSKLMNLLAARRSALQKDRFRMHRRFGTTGRSVIGTAASTPSSSIETTSRSPTDPRSLCIRNCTKNFTRRTTASCMRQCATFQRTKSNSNSTLAETQTTATMLMNNSDKDTNEILFTDESSHGLFVVTKDLNDTFNHIPEMVKTSAALSSTDKTYKFRTRVKSHSSSAMSIEDAEIAPYLYFGQKLPPIRPGLLSITSVSDDHPKLLEVSVAKTTTLAPLIQRARSRVKFNPRERNAASINRRFRPSSALLIGSAESKNTSADILELKPTISSVDVTLENVEINNRETKTEVIDGAIIGNEPTSMTSTTPPSSTPLLISVFSDEENTEFSTEVSNTESEPPSKAIDDVAPEDHSEDTKRLRAIGPSLTEEIHTDDKTNLIIFVNKTAEVVVSSAEPPPVLPSVPSIDSTTTTTSSPAKHVSSTDSSSKILRTTILSSVRSTVHPRTSTEAQRPPSSTDKENPDPFSSSIFQIFGTSSVEEISPSAAPSEILVNEESSPSIVVTAEEREVAMEMSRINMTTYVLAGIGIIPIIVIILYVVRNFILKRNLKNDEDFDVCITDQQPISPVKKLDSKFSHNEDGDGDSNDEDDDDRGNNNHNNRYEEQCSVSSDQEFDRSNIRLKSLLGEGNFGQVWKAEADDLSGHLGATRIVAVKTVRACSAQLGLKDEANIMRKLGSHPNVVTLLGACVESEPHMLIMEYAMRGRLLSLLRAARSATNILPASVPGGRSLAPLSPRTLAGFALDISRGMEYIAERRIVHRDLAARNVLLDHNGVCKICDFGMSIDLDAEEEVRKKKSREHSAAADILRSNSNKFKFDFGGNFIMSQWSHSFNNQLHQKQQHHGAEKKLNGQDTIGRRPALPIRWMAPEALQYHIFSTETDVWAFGIVLWEIATLGSTPYANLSGREVVRRVPNGLRPDLPKEGRHEFSNLMARCWHKDDQMRPSFRQARMEISRSLCKWVDDDSAASDYMDVSGFSEDLEHGMVYFNHRISEFECEI